MDVVWIGRGGQGAFTAAKVLGAAYSMREGGGYALAFPSFGPERRGAPVRAFTKLSEKPVSNRCEVSRGDYAVYLDETLFPGGSAAGAPIVSSREAVEGAIAIDARGIGEGIFGSPIVNTAMLGALARVWGGVSLDDVCEGIERVMAERHWERNKEAAGAAYDAAGDSL
ncbi:MAG: 2-oxoacid:acceptor oxidoreductase family protein [Candidatus Methanoplasma sp.]|jgi:pyruvate ferredoxin oxidoreductase gamma subunit|nr:2-oxoacid:acceptor oxidoreductase family protein [Candidatus Methanoplasma sp.]